MKVLLDECVPKDLCNSLPKVDCWTASRAGFAGKKNGELLKLAEDANFDVLITVDRSIQYQQKWTGRRIALLAVYPRSNKLIDLVPMWRRVLKHCAESNAELITIPG